MPEPDVERELTLIDLADRSRKARLRSLLGNKRGREKFLRSLYHDPPFDPRYVTVVDDALSRIEERLVARGAPADCYVISNDPEYDARIMPLRAALDAMYAGWEVEGAIALCIPGRLAFYCGEAVNGGGYEWIVERPTSGEASPHTETNRVTRASPDT